MRDESQGQWLTTACPRNCYSTCGMRVEIHEGRVVAIESHPENLATSEGLCLKGLSYIERMYAPERLLHPLRRTTDGVFERVSWDTAFTTISEQIQQAREKWGPQSVFYYAGSGTKGLLNNIGNEFWRLFGGCTTTYGDLCWPAGLEAARLTLGANTHNDPWDIEKARLILLWGKNPAETNVHQMRFIEDARRQGATLVVIDPRRTESAEQADLLVQIRPGTDGALALGMAHLLIAEDRVDHGFLARAVAGFDTFAERVQQYTPSRVAQITGVPEATIHFLAELTGTIRPVTICAGFGMQRYTNGGQTMRAMIALLALTGNIGAPGAGWVYANLQSHVFTEFHDPLALYPPRTPDPQIRMSVSTTRLGRDMARQESPPLKVAWVERGNPITQNPETHRVLESFHDLDFRIVIDQFMTDTAREADLVLPAKTLFEQSDVITAYWHPYIQFKQKLVEPPSEVKPESEIYLELARRLGLEKQWFEQGLPGSGDEAIEAYLEGQLDRWDGPGLDALREGPQLPKGHQPVAFADGVFPTPSGKIELISTEAEVRWQQDGFPDYREIAEGRDPEYPLHLLTPNSKDRIHTQFNNLETIRGIHPRTRLHMNPEDAAQRGIDEGMTVRVFNQRGEISIEVTFDLSLRPGCVWITNGWWISEGGGVNFLSASRETDIGHGAAFHDNFVEVSR